MMQVKTGIALAAMLFIGAGLALSADETKVPAPAGSALLMELGADGMQIYACEAKDKGFEWVFKSPEANLFDDQGRQAGTHFGGPTWKLADGSAAVGEVAARADAPEAGAIPWLLLRVKSREGSGALSRAGYVRRVDTKGGAVPKSGCDASHVSEQARVRYSASYLFYSAGK